MSKNNSNKPTKSALATLLQEKSAKTSAFVSPVLQQVGKLAAGVANVSTGLGLNTASATGNPRNKCALQPGHSLMDWIRLGSSGKDLTGVGPRAGHLSVTKTELFQHRKEDDAWLAIRGKVYNVTAYLPFHPGGQEELMKGAGIDATKLFDQVHPWVNYEQILQKCYIGKLVAVTPSIDAESLFFGDKVTPTKSTTESDKDLANSPQRIPETFRGPQNKEVPERKRQEPPKEQLKQEFTLPHNPPEFKEPKLKFLEKYPPKVESTSQEDQPDDSLALPRFDWIQKTRSISLIFYTNAFSNPLVEIFPPNQERTLIVTLTYDDMVFTNEIVLHDNVVWPCTTHISYETGKIDLEFQKAQPKVWEDFGDLVQRSEPGTAFNCCAKCNFIIAQKVQVTHSIFLIRIMRTDNSRMVVPIGKHIRAFGNVSGQEMSRSYTPIPQSFFTQFVTQAPATDTLCLMIKRYDEGNVSRFLTDREENDVIHVTRPVGDFDLKLLRKREIFLLLAAGTGITPMLSVLQFLLDRRIKKCQFVRLMFFNRTESDIPFREQFEVVQSIDGRLNVTHILSEPNSQWTGLKGHINKEMIENAIDEHIRDTGYTISNIFTFICGPNPFIALSLEEIKKIGITEEQIHVFQG